MAIIFLHDANSSGADISSFFSSMPLESFGYKPFKEVCNTLGIQIVTPTAKICSKCNENGEDDAGQEGWEWYAASPDWKVLGLENSLSEDASSIDLSKTQIDKTICEWEDKCDFIFIGGFSHGGNMCLQLLNENNAGAFQVPPENNNISKSVASIKRKHPKVAGLFTMASFLPLASDVYSHSYNRNLSNGKSDTSEKSMEEPTNSSKLSLLMMHGDKDDEVPAEWGNITASQLILHDSICVRFHSFPDTEHEISEDELHVLLDWVEASINNMKPAGEGIIFDLGKEDNQDDKIAPKHNFRIDPVVGDVANLYRITYPVERDAIVALTGRPVLACGGMFDVTEVSNGVQCTVHSSAPEKTALEIGKRLHARVVSHRDGSGNAGEDICVIA